MPVPGVLIAFDPRRPAALDPLAAAAGASGGPVRTWSEGPLALAVAGGEARGLHVGARFVAVLEGSLYDRVPTSATSPARDGAAPPPHADGAAGWLAGQPWGESSVRGRRGVAALLARLRGEYWALVWDRERESGVIACDQLGVRSPFWIAEGSRVLCGSDLTHLLSALARRPAPDPLALAHWLMMTIPPDGATLYGGIRRLPAAHTLALGDPAQARPLTAAPSRYWAPVYHEPERATRAEAAGELRAALQAAVDRRLRIPASAVQAGDRRHGQIGVLLSGGLDSSGVAALAAAAQPRASTYSAVFPDHPEADESALIDHTTARLGLPSARVVVRETGVLGGALRYLRAWQVPPTSPNLFFWLPLLERAAADGITVMLDGEGGDEVFAFSPYLLADRLRQGHWLQALRLATRWPGSPSRPGLPVLAERLSGFGLRAALPPAAHLAMRRLRGLRSYAPAWLPPPLARRWLEEESSAFAYKRLDGPRWWAYLVDATTCGMGSSAGFEQARRRTALAGIQARHPLVDVDVIELVLRLDPELAFDRRFGRPLLREALNGLLDDRIRLRRHKSHFDTVFHAGLARHDLLALRGLLDPARAQLAAYVDLAALHGELFARPPDAHPWGRQAWALTAWRAATAECWLRLQSGWDPALPLGAREERARFEPGPTVAT